MRLGLESLSTRSWRYVEESRAFYAIDSTQDRRRARGRFRAATIAFFRRMLNGRLEIFMTPPTPELGSRTIQGTCNCSDRFGSSAPPTEFRHKPPRPSGLFCRIPAAKSAEVLGTSRSSSPAAIVVARLLSGCRRDRPGGITLRPIWPEIRENRNRDTTGLWVPHLGPRSWGNEGREGELDPDGLNSVWRENAEIAKIARHDARVL